MISHSSQTGPLALLCRGMLYSRLSYINWLCGKVAID